MTKHPTNRPAVLWRYIALSSVLVGFSDPENGVMQPYFFDAIAMQCGPQAHIKFRQKWHITSIPQDSLDYADKSVQSSIVAGQQIHAARALPKSSNGASSLRV